MGIEIASETLLTIKQYCEFRGPGRGGKPMSPLTAYRHINIGVRGIRLEHTRVGGTVYTSVEAVQRFADALTDAKLRKYAPAAIAIPAARRRKDEAVARELDALGV
ncbi:MAG: hypothetical protein JWN86_1416 [Planctomycetota bacterium]|nr:hypothetical protein [Planctomycetota bacterium]